MEDTAVRDQKGSLRSAYRITQDTVAAIDPMSDTTLFDLKVLHNHVQRKLTANLAAAQAGRRSKSKEAAGGNVLRHRKRRENAGGNQEHSAQARCLREFAEELDTSTKSTCKVLSWNHKALEELACSDTTFRCAGAHGLFKACDAETSDPSDDEMGVHKCRSTMSLIKGAFKASNLEAQKKADAFVQVGVDCMRQVTAFLLERGDLRVMLESFDLTGTGMLKCQELDHGLMRLGWTGDALQVWGHLSKGYKQVAVSEAERTLSMYREDATDRPRMRRASTTAS